MYLEEEIKTLKKEVSDLKETLVNLSSEIKANRAVKTLTVEQVAKQLGISKGGVLYHIRKGNIKAIGGKQRYKKITEEELLTFKSKVSNKTK